MLRVRSDNSRAPLPSLLRRVVVAVAIIVGLVHHASAQSNSSLSDSSLSNSSLGESSLIPFDLPSTRSAASTLATSQLQSKPEVESAVVVVSSPENAKADDGSVSIRQNARRWIPLPEGIFPPLTGWTPEEHRHAGLGKPLIGTMSWNAMPHSAGFYFGGIDSGQSLHNHLTHHLGTTFGMRFGVDYDYHWGLEKRFGFASMDSRHVNANLRDQTELEFGDVDLYYYPWGDSQWRPFVMCGIGLSRFNHEDDHEHIERYLLTSPFGIGLKRLVNNGWSLRMEIADNLMLGNGEVGTMNNMSLAGGAEFRYHGFRWVR